MWSCYINADMLDKCFITTGPPLLLPFDLDCIIVDTCPRQDNFKCVGKVEGQIVCQPGSYQCDDFIDCPDGSDEWNCSKWLT